MFCECLNTIFARPRRRGRGRCGYLPVLESLETRITPATFSENSASHILTITLDGVNESVAFAATPTPHPADFTKGVGASAGVAPSRVSGFGSSNVTITAAGVAFYNEIDVV